MLHELPHCEVGIHPLEVDDCVDEVAQVLVRELPYLTTVEKVHQKSEHIVVRVLRVIDEQVPQLLNLLRHFVKPSLF